MKQLPVLGLADLDGSCRCSDDRAPPPHAPRRGSAVWPPAVCAEVRWEELQRDVAPQPLVVRLVDEAHSAGAEEVQHHILPDAPSFPSGDLRSGPGGRGRDRRSPVDRPAPARSWAASSDSTSRRRSASPAHRSLEQLRSIAGRRTRSPPRARPARAASDRATSDPRGARDRSRAAAPDSARRAPSPIPA